MKYTTITARIDEATNEKLDQLIKHYKNKGIPMTKTDIIEYAIHVLSVEYNLTD